MLRQKRPMPPTDLRPSSLPMLPVLAAVMICALFWPISTSDIELSYVPWLQHIAAAGPAAALGEPFGDYSPPYYYLLAALSFGRGAITDESLVKLAGVVSTVFLAFAVRYLLDTLRVENSGRYAAYLLLLPGVMFNAAVSASCDALWATAGVMAVAMAVQRRNNAMLLWCGIAFAIKAQAIFAAPFIVGLLIARRVPLQSWLIVPAAMVALYLPALILGWPLSDLLTVYFRQAGFFERLSLNAPNLWAAVQLFPAVDPRLITNLAYAAAATASVTLIIVVARRRLEGPALIAAATLSILLLAGLLPRMHERYFFLADVLAFCFAVAARSRSAWVTAALVQLGSGLGIAAYATATPELAAIGAVPMALATWRFAKVVLSSEEPVADPESPKEPVAA